MDLLDPLPIQQAVLGFAMLHDAPQAVLAYAMLHDAPQAVLAYDVQSDGTCRQ